MHAHEQDVARLRVGEHAIAPHVRVHIHETADQSQDDAELDGLGNLFRALHEPLPSSRAGHVMMSGTCTAYAMRTARDSTAKI